MVIGDFHSPQDMRPAARDELAAAGPVEPSSSPGVAPGPTFFFPTKSCGEYFHCHARIAGLAPEGDADVPTLAFVPGIVITGRYRMRPPS
jgi:hypothetical protein